LLGASAALLRVFGTKFLVLPIALMAAALAPTVYFAPFSIAGGVVFCLIFYVGFPILILFISIVSLAAQMKTEKLLRNRVSSTAISILLLFISALIQIWLLSD